MKETEDKFNFIHLDKRVIENRLKRHLTNQKECQKLVSSLPDEAEKSDQLLVFKEEEAKGFS
ncbi:MAG: hypothetical protein HYW02_05695 [Deltaproteobacteria bacterium]|nr:hypothetical protein [Deltaproteobacteria bacterium]MBI2500948.1 hypothetical protein [Deltaproteobacteria bacterium]MBI4196379.1 hypothetical protein [Deltaproteobacteria bacterium]